MQNGKNIINRKYNGKITPEPVPELSRPADHQPKPTNLINDTLKRLLLIPTSLSHKTPPQL